MFVSSSSFLFNVVRYTNLPFRQKKTWGLGRVYCYMDILYGYVICLAWSGGGGGEEAKLTM